MKKLMFWGKKTDQKSHRADATNSIDLPSLLN
jgi:hypothetical protein